MYFFVVDWYLCVLQQHTMMIGGANDFFAIEFFVERKNSVSAFRCRCMRAEKKLHIDDAVDVRRWCKCVRNAVRCGRSEKGSQVKSRKKYFTTTSVNDRREKTRSIQLFLRYFRLRWNVDHDIAVAHEHFSPTFFTHHNQTILNFFLYISSEFCIFFFCFFHLFIRYVPMYTSSSTLTLLLSLFYSVCMCAF